MILDVLVFALGFMVAGLIALAALPAVWRRALRLSEERLSRLVPLSPEEIAAERDHLRAAHAVELRRAEQRLEGAEAARTALRVEAARREARIAALDEAAIRATVRIAELEAGLAQVRREADELWAERGAEAQALDGLARLGERRLEEVAALQAEREALRHEVDRNRGSLAGLETRLLGAEARGGDLQRELERARRDAAAAAERLAAETAALGELARLGERRQDDIAALQAERDGLRQEAERGRGSLAGLETRLLGAEARGGDLERELERARHDAAAAAERLTAERDAAAAADRHAHEVEALRAELAFMAEQAHSAERRAAESARAHDALKAERGGEGATPEPRGDAALRAAIAALAGEVMRAGETVRA